MEISNGVIAIIGVVAFFVVFLGLAHWARRKEDGGARRHMLRCSPEDDELLAELLARAVLAKVQPRPTGGDIVRAGLRALVRLDNRELAKLLESER